MSYLYDRVSQMDTSNPEAANAAFNGIAIMVATQEIERLMLGYPKSSWPRLNEVRSALSGARVTDSSSIERLAQCLDKVLANE